MRVMRTITTDLNDFGEIRRTGRVRVDKADGGLNDAGKSVNRARGLT